MFSMFLFITVTWVSSHVISFLLHQFSTKFLFLRSYLNNNDDALWLEQEGNDDTRIKVKFVSHLEYQFCKYNLMRSLSNKNGEQSPMNAGKKWFICAKNKSIANRNCLKRVSLWIHVNEEKQPRISLCG